MQKTKQRTEEQDKDFKSAGPRVGNNRGQIAVLNLAFRAKLAEKVKLE